MGLRDGDTSALVSKLEGYSFGGPETSELDVKCRYACARIDAYSEVNPLLELFMYGLKLYFRPLYDLIKKKRD